jgi:general stress protein CsbA
MKILLAIIVVALVAASIYADYKWREWMAARRRDRQ